VQYGTESVVVRIFNTYWPGRVLQPVSLRELSAFMYCALHGLAVDVCSALTGARRPTSRTPSARSRPSPTASVPARSTTSAATAITRSKSSPTSCCADGRRDPRLVEYRDAEVLTTRVKRVDISKAVRDLDHRTTVSLEEGVPPHVAWMRDAYRLPQRLIPFQNIIDCGRDSATARRPLHLLRGGGSS
jgi:dTDP-glucose 4,6-dehydratase